MNKKTYYHYLPAEDAIDDLENEWIKVSTFNTLNDPFEMMPYRRFDPKGRQPYDKVFRDVSKKWGLLCFSLSWKEQLLWAHYAAGHKGIALGFEILKDEIFELAYTSSKIRTKFDLTSDPEEDEKRFLDLAKIKYQEWKYEKEHRVLVKLEDCLPPDSKGRCFLPFRDRLKLKEIVLGCRFDNKNQKTKIKNFEIQLNAKAMPKRAGFEDYKIHNCGYWTDKYEK